MMISIPENYFLTEAANSIRMYETVNKQRLPFLLVVIIATFAVLSVGFTNNVDASSLTGASVTLSNSRMSFKAPIFSGAVNTSLVTISGAVPDTTTNHLFPGDNVCFTDAGNNVCRDNKTYTVDNVPSSTTFNLTSPLTTALTATDYAVASESGSWTITFTTVNTVPVNGKLIITIPANDANATAQNNDGMPDSAANVSTNGFDMNKLAAANATVTAATGTCTYTDWGSSGAANSITLGGGGTTDTTISWTRGSTTCEGPSTITVSIASPYIVNPAPITGHTQGNADIYGITIATTDGTNTIDSAVPKVAPVEAVLVSGTVDETLSFAVAAVAGSDLYTNSYCGTVPSSSDAVTTYAYSIPWGHFGTTNHFYYAAQQLTVSTNAASGYVVTIQENDQMGRNGGACPSGTPSTGDWTFTGSDYCIRDTQCASGGTCTFSIMGDWPTASGYGGLGYSLATASGTTAAPFYFNQGGRTFNAKDLPDIENSEAVQTIMSGPAPVSGDSVYVCYKISIPGTQPSGYYYNIVKYTATATF
jgi:hypothetical protein